MGWKTCLPAICVTNTSIHVSHRISQAFEENLFSDESIQFVSAFEFCDKDKKSSHKTPSFMCDYCAYSSESKMNLFEHFIKSHVFLCTLCSYAGVSRSCILKHCFESHQKVMEEKMHHLKSYKLNVDKLLGELDISPKGYSDFTTSSTFNEFYDNNSDCSSDEEYPESSFLAKSRTKGSWNAILSSDEESEIENKRGKSSRHKSKFKPIPNHHSKESKANSSSFSQDKDSDHGTNSRENILHFLDTTHSQKDEEDDFNEFSDSSQMDYFFSQQGNENESDFGESIFHDHKEMFMVSRLPFPIRQDDSPNDPFNEGAPQPETSSTILQSILQQDKQEPSDSAGSSGINSSSEKVSETTREPESISPGLSIPTGETLQKQFETAMSESSVFSYSDTMSQDVVGLTASQPVTEECVQTPKEGLDVIEILPLSAEKDNVKTLTKSSQDGKNLLDNFLLPPRSYDKKERTNEENSHNELAPQRENTDDKEGKFTLLRNLLKDKHKPDGNQAVEEYENSKKNAQAPVSVKNASDMSLHELLSMDTPFPLSTRPNYVQKDNAGSNDDSRSLHSVTLECDVCEQTFFNKSIFERHVKICTAKKQSPTPIPNTLVQRKNNIPGKNKHSLLSHHIQSSLKTGHFTTPKVFPKISKSPLELAPANGKSMPLSDDVFKDNNKRGASFSRPSLKYRKTRPQNLLSQHLQVKHRNRKWEQPRDTEAVAGDGPEVRTMKRKLEQDKDYDPESESSETSDDVTADSIKQRKKAKRVRKHIISSMRQQKPKLSSAVTLMSKLCEKALGDQIANASSENSEFPSLLSSSFSSSSSSILSTSSSSSSASSLLSNSQTSVVGVKAQEKEMELMLSSSNQHSKGIDTKQQECSIVGISKVSVKTEAEDNVECEDEQTSSSFQIRNTSLASNTNHKVGSSQTLLQHLLIMPTNTMHYPQELSQKTSSSLQSISVLKYDKQSAEKCNDKHKQMKKGVPVEIKDESNDKNGLQLHPRPLDLVLPGPNSYKSSKFARSRSQSLTEVEIRTDACCKETNQTRLGPRLSASMMDVPDPPAIPFSSDDLESLKPPGLPLLLPPLSPPPSSQSWSIKPQVLSQCTSNIPSLKRQESTAAKATIKPTIQASGLDFLPCPSSEPAMCAVNTSTSTAPALTVSAYSSLLRNLLMQHTDTSGGKH